MLLVEALALSKCLLCEIKYIYKMKSLEACYKNNKKMIKKIQTAYYP